MGSWVWLIWFCNRRSRDILKDLVLSMITMAVSGILMLILTISAVMSILIVLGWLELLVNCVTMLVPLVAGTCLRTMVTCIFVSGFLVNLRVACMMLWAPLGVGKLSLVRLVGRLLSGLNLDFLLTCG